MKKARRIAAMIAAMAMAAMMAVSAMSFSAGALTKNTVTIVGEQATSSAKKHSYKAYKIFDGTVDEGQLKNITFAGSDFNEFLTALKSDAKLGNDFDTVTDVAGVAAKLANYSNDSTETKAFAQFVAEHTNLIAAAVESATTEGNQNTIPLTTDGYYVIIEVVPAETQTDFAMTSYILAQYDASEGADINAKSTVPSVDKQVQDEETDAEAGATDGWGETADHAINESFKFKLTATLEADANYGAYKTYKIQFNDTLSAGVTYDDIVSVKVNGTTINSYDKDPNGYQLTEPTVTAPALGGGNLTITIADIKKFDADLTDGATIEVIYNAHLNANAAVETEDKDSVGTDYDNVNKVNLEYSNNPNAGGAGDTGKTPEDYVWVFTYSVENVKKKDSETGENLAGAKFKLYTTKTAGTPDTYSGEIKLINNEDGTYTVANQTATTDDFDELVSADSTGKFDIKGLDAGTYYLVETEAPSGYKLAEPIEIVIGATHKEKDTTGTAAQVTMEASQNMSNTIIDESGSTLPSTGGIGTLMFVLCGGVAAGIAGVYLVSKKKTREEEV